MYRRIRFCLAYAIAISGGVSLDSACAGNGGSWPEDVGVPSDVVSADTADSSEVMVPPDATSGDEVDGPSWIQERSDERPDQEVSSLSRCYCFPEGDICHAGLLRGVDGPAPTDYPPCVPNEVCNGESSSYENGFDVPRGQCHRICYHRNARIPTALTDEQRSFLGMDCSAREECRLTAVMIGFEDTPGGEIGMCWPTPTPSGAEARPR